METDPLIIETPTIEQQDKLGAEIAAILGLQHDPTHKTRWMTGWGSKTNIGIYNTIIRIANDLDSGVMLESLET